VILAVFLLALPFFVRDFVLTLVNVAFVYIIATIGLNVLFGYTGLISLGSAAFLGIGGFSAGIVAAHLGWPFWLAIIFGGLVGMVVGLIIALPALRLTGLYLLIATFALHYIVIAFLRYYERAYRLYSGIRFPRMAFGEFIFDTPAKTYYLFLAITIIVLLIVYNIMRTGLGRSFLAVRDNQTSAKAVGVNVNYTKVRSFALSSFLIAVAGGLLGFNMRRVAAEVFDFNLIIDSLVALFIGGQATIIGPVLGGIFVTVFPLGIKFLADAISALPIIGPIINEHIFEINRVLYGLSMVLVLMYKPQGLAELFSDLVQFLSRYRRR
jgi:branched-chain amino acid transport system permease protein